jgi:hypothetical protein
LTDMTKLIAANRNFANAVLTKAWCWLISFGNQRIINNVKYEDNLPSTYK